MERFAQSMNIALNAIWLNRGRAALTMLGIVIGIAAVVALVSLGRGVEDFVLGEFQSLGSDILTVTSTQPESERRTRIDPLTSAEAERIAQRPNVLTVAAEFNVPGMLAVANEETTIATAKGITTNLPALQSLTLAAGTPITDAHQDTLARVALLGSETANTLYPDVAPDEIVGQSLRYNNQIFEIIGVLDPNGTGIGDIDQAVLIPLTTAQQRLTDARTGGSAEVTTIYVQALDGNSTAAAELDVHAVLQAAHNIPTPDQRDYRVNDESGLLDSVTEVTGILTIFLGVIASISLVVGGIGIMNIMLVTVTERTREIGLRKAVGAQPIDILAQFLLESLVLSVAGGILGVLVAVLLTNLTSALIPDLTVSVQADAILLATVIASLVGIVFGLLPAQQAANMNPIDALRHE